MNNRPFFNVHSPALRDMLGVEDVRSVKARLKKIGVELYGSGKDSYIITEEVIDSLRKNKKGGVYVSKNPANNFI